MNNTPDFESIKQISPYGVEYWSARDLAPLLGYQKWERFEGAIERATISCKKSCHVVADHFPSAGKMVSLGSAAKASGVLSRNFGIFHNAGYKGL